MYTKKQRLYKKAERILGDKTPLKKDCGLLCGGACCKGDRETGMLLFPGEQTSLDIIEKDGVRLAVCDGKCDRGERPLSCRIFPFFPYITSEGRVKVIPDIRGYSVCPLVRNFSDVKLDRAFLRRVRELGRLLMTDDDCKAFLMDISDEMDKIIDLMA